MTDSKYDVLALGDAMVDILSPASEALIAREGLPRGEMRVIDADEARRLESLMPAPHAVSGGSAANSMAGLAMLSGRAAFVGQVADDRLGRVFTNNLSALDVALPKTPNTSGPGTGRCLIFVTPDGERTMNTFRGASETLELAPADDAEIAAADMIYLEAYLWDQTVPRRAMRRALTVAREAGRQVAFTTSAVQMVERNRADINALIADARLDLIFANEAELLALTRAVDFDGAMRAMQDRAPLVIVTRSEKGAVALYEGEAIAVPAVPVARVADTTGAGDLFAAGFFAGGARGLPLADCLELGAKAAADVISEIGARPAPGLSERLGI
ncbi:MAG: adenosine kinase [Pacificimonas sp.]